MAVAGALFVLGADSAYYAGIWEVGEMRNDESTEQAREEAVAWYKERMEQDAKEGKGRERPVKEPLGLGKRLFIGFVGLVFFAAGVFMLLEVSLPALMLRIGGTASQGVINELIKSKYTSGPQGQSVESKYHVYYSFALPSGSGEAIEGHTQISGGQWSSLRVGQTVKVLYLPNNPRHNCLADYRLWEIGIVLMIVFPPLFAGIGILVLLSAIRPQVVDALFDKFAGPSRLRAHK